MTARKKPDLSIKAEPDNPFASGKELFDDTPAETEPEVQMGEPEIDTAAALSAPDLSPGPTPKKRAPRKPKPEVAELTSRDKLVHEFADFPLDRLPFDARSGQIEGAIRVHNGLPVASLSIAGWVGDPNLVILAAELGDLQDVVDSLLTQVVEARK